MVVSLASLSWLSGSSRVERLLIGLIVGILLIESILLTAKLINIMFCSRYLPIQVVLYLAQK